MEKKINAVIVQLGFMAGLIASLLTMSGCSFKCEVGYFGKTSKDDRNMSPEVVERKNDRR